MSSHPSTQPQLTPERIFFTLNSYQQAYGLKGAIELDVFTHIADGAATAADIAARAHASERGMRILCDYLTVLGFLNKADGRYTLAQDAAVFLNKHSPAYLGGTTKFLMNEFQMHNFHDVAAFVRNGGALKGTGDMTPDNDVWVDFARSMLPIVFPATQAVAAKCGAGKMKVLDIAAGHGMFGIAIAQRNPDAEIVAVDWKNVLAVAVENAEKAGVRNRYRTVAGSAFEVDFGSGFDIALLPNFLHHFDVPTNVALLKKIRAALNPGARVLTVEFVPNEDRITPPVAAAFSFMMLGGTEGGDAYTFRELESMFRQAGFRSTTMEPIPNSPEQLLVTEA